MVRKTVLGLSCLMLALGLTGCTWTETKRDYPRSIERPPLAAGHDHGHGHQH
ncbi:hypothetical protein [Planctomyces sp. SH-PL62]|uniref:hypothetical protein n=1 Tax=Planctomyces sp. SH-PL62 TaxID=1636152 RepID=UPI00078D8230|nr:hypothetical protein [Planctomyces sp. SH-PL62]AMV39023.1 hypothetical protein VT85_16420 [Planctomyces sp. SH-PL62]